MTKLAQKLTEKISIMPDEEQDVIAGALLEWLENGSGEEESEWDALVSSPGSQTWLEKESEKSYLAPKKFTILILLICLNDLENHSAVLGLLHKAT